MAKDPTDGFKDFMKMFDPANVSKMFDPQAMIPTLRPVSSCFNGPRSAARDAAQAGAAGCGCVPSHSSVVQQNR